MSLIKNTTLIHAINLTSAQAEITLLEPKRTGQGVHIVPVQYGTGTVPAFLQVQKPDLYWTRLTVRIAFSEDLSEPEPFGTRSVWQSLRIQTAVEISAQVSFHTFLRRCKA